MRFFFLLLLNYDYKTSPIYKFWFYKIIVTYRSKKFKFHLRAFWLFFKPVWHSEDNIKLFIKIISPSRYVIKRKRSGWFHIKIHRNNILNIKINNIQNIKAKFFFWYHFMSRLFLILPFSCEMRLEDFTLLKIKSGGAFPKTTTSLPEIFEFVFSCKGESLFQACISMKKKHVM